MAEAEAADFDPEWSVTGDTVTDAVAQFYEASAAAFDGAIGVGDYFEPDEPGDPETADLACTEAITGPDDDGPDSDSDEFGINAIICRTIDLVVAGIEATDDLRPEALIAGLESIDDLDVGFGARGGFSADRHDAGASLAVREFDAATTRFIWPGEETVEVP